MTTAAGRAHAISRLTSCPDIDALRLAWARLGKDYQRDSEVCSVKDKMKAGFDEQP